MSDEPTNPPPTTLLDAEAVADCGELRIVVKVGPAGPDLQTSCNLKLAPAHLGYIIGCAEGAARAMMREVVATALPEQRNPVAEGHAKGFAWAADGDDWREVLVGDANREGDVEAAQRRAVLASDWGPYVHAMETLRERVDAYRQLAFNPSGGIVDILNATNDSARAMFDALDGVIKARPK